MVVDSVMSEGLAVLGSASDTVFCNPSEVSVPDGLAVTCCAMSLGLAAAFRLGF